MCKRRHGSLTDVIVLIVCLLVLAVFIFAFSHRAARNNNRVYCASNLRQIGQAMLNYANDNAQNFPRTLYVPDAPPTQFTGAGAASPFVAGGVAPNDVSAAMFLLMKEEGLTPYVFICRDSTATPLPAVIGANFPSDANLSYSMTNPHPASKVKFDWTTKLPATFALFADINPGFNSAARFCANTPANSTDWAHMSAGNSPNHRGAGQEVLFADGHVEWANNPFDGDNHDNIYTVSDGPAGPNYTNPAANAAAPSHPLDSVLLPAALQTELALATPVVVEPNLWPKVFITFGVLYSLTAVVIVGVRRRGRTAAR